MNQLQPDAFYHPWCQQSWHITWFMDMYVGHCQGWSDAQRGFNLSWWHSSQYLTMSSVSWSKLGHHTKCCSRDFILNIPGWAPWILANIVLQPCGDTTTRFPHKIQSAWVDSFIYLFYPNMMYCITVDNTGSLGSCSNLVNCYGSLIQALNQKN